MQVPHPVRAPPQGPPATETPGCLVCAQTTDGVVVGTKARFGMSVRNICCENCGFVYASPRPTREAMAEYYRSTYREHYKEVGLNTEHGFVHPGQPAFDVALENWHRQQALRTMRAARTSPSARVLEIGCRDARTLVMLREQRNIEAYGIEPGENEARQANANGVRCFCGTFEDYDAGGIDFDQIQMFHVLEHVHDPLATLVRIRSLLAPAGRVVIEVPNVCQPYGLLEENFFQNVHLSNFSANTLSALFRRAGFEIDVVVDTSFLLIVGHADPSLRDSPIPFSTELLSAPEQNAAFISARLSNYADLEKIRTLFRVKGPSRELAQVLARAAQRPAFVEHLATVVCEAVESLSAAGFLNLASQVASTAARGPHPLEIREGLTRLSLECVGPRAPAEQ